jgi:hypothetical protein
MLRASEFQTLFIADVAHATFASDAAGFRFFDAKKVDESCLGSSNRCPARSVLSQ